MPLSSLVTTYFVCFLWPRESMSDIGEMGYIQGYVMGEPLEQDGRKNVV